MGNLRSKYTDEEWDALVEESMKRKDVIETLYNWFSKQDIVRLQKWGWFIHEFEAVDFKFYERFQHQVINQETSKVLRVIDLEEEPVREAALANYKELYEGEPLTWEVPVDAFIKGVEWKEKNLSDDLELRCNFISVDNKVARNSYGEFFKIGDEVGHDGHDDGTAKILSFELDEESNEVKAHTSKGWSHLDFIFKNENLVD